MRTVPHPWPAALALLLALPGAGRSEEPAEPSRPNVLLVTLDTTRADHLGCYGAKGAGTPSLDSLAGAGVRFDQAQSPAPLTLPSHASLFTGLVPRRHGVRNNALYRLGPRVEVLAERLAAAGYRRAAFVSSAVLDRIAGLDRGFELYEDTVRVGAREAFNYEERAAGQTNEAVLDSLETLEEPFFLWVHYFDPHLPYVPPEPFRSRFAGRPYQGEIAYMDERLGELLAAVRERSPSLLVIVAGDHGESLGEHGEESHGVFLYQSTQRVPLIMAGPGLPRGSVVSEPVGLVDLAPTLLDLLGLPPLEEADGRSLLPLIAGTPVPAAGYEMETFFPLQAYGWSPLRALLRDGDKYIRAPRPELYRLGSDPHEARNLVGESGERAAALSTELEGLVGDDEPALPAADPDLAGQRERLEALGYLTGSGGARARGGEVGAIDPKEGIAWLALLDEGRRAYQTGNPAQGIEPLLRLLERNPGNVPALLALAQCYLGTGQAAKAVEADHRALALRPEDDLVHFNLANALSVLGETRSEAPPEARREALKRARVHYERTLELNPRRAEAYLNYASFLERAGAVAEARALLERGRRAGVRDPDLEIRVAVLELKRGEVEAAKMAFGRSLELNPRAAGPLEAMARLTERQGLFAEAADWYARLLEVTPSAGLARALGDLRYEKLGDAEGAARAWRRALELTPPEDPERGELIERLRRLPSPPDER